MADSTDAVDQAAVLLSMDQAVLVAFLLSQGWTYDQGSSSWVRQTDPINTLRNDGNLAVTTSVDSGGTLQATFPQSGFGTG